MMQVCVSVGLKSSHEALRLAAERELVEALSYCSRRRVLGGESAAIDQQLTASGSGAEAFVRAHRDKIAAIIACWRAEAQSLRQHAEAKLTEAQSVEQLLREPVLSMNGQGAVHIIREFLGAELSEPRVDGLRREARALQEQAISLDEKCDPFGLIADAYVGVAEARSIEELLRRVVEVGLAKPPRPTPALIQICDWAFRAACEAGGGAWRFRIRWSGTTIDAITGSVGGSFVERIDEHV